MHLRGEIISLKLKILNKLNSCPLCEIFNWFICCYTKMDIHGMELDLIHSVVEGANVDNCEGGSLFCTKNPCKNGGQCLENTTCSCPRGFSGRYCENRDMCSLTPCKNGGTCFSMKNSYRCSCAKSYFGKDCETGNR